MVDSTSISEYSRFTALEQTPDPSPVKPHPRHPYAFCQCEGEDCAECLREQIQLFKEELQAKDEALKIARRIASNALRRSSIKREEIEYLAHIDEPDLSNN